MPLTSLKSTLTAFPQATQKKAGYADANSFPSRTYKNPPATPIIPALTKTRGVGGAQQTLLWQRSETRLLRGGSAFGDQVAAAGRADFGGMNRARGHIAAVPNAIGLRFAAARQRHFAVQNNVGRVNPVGMFGVLDARSILPNIEVDIAFL